MLADNQTGESSLTQNFRENFQTAYPFAALPTQPRYRQVPPHSVRIAFPLVAKRLGIDKAHILNQIQFWMKKSEVGYFKRYNGQIRKWVWFTYEMLATQLPWMSAQKIGRHIRDFEDLDFVLSTNEFNATRYDRTKWYSLNYIAIDDYLPDNPYAEYAVRPQTIESSKLNIREFSDERSNIYYPQRKSTYNNNIGNDAFLKIGKEEGGTSTGTSSYVVQDEYCTNNWQFSLPKDVETIADESQDDRVCEETVCSPPPKPKLPKPKKREEVKQEAQNNPQKEDIGQALDDAGLFSPKLMSLALKYSLEAVQKTIAMLNQQGNAIKNPRGWFTKCLKGQWWKQNEQPRQRKKKAQPIKSWEAEFNPWYTWAISEGIVQDVNVRYLPGNHHGEPLVRLAVPDRFSRAPYTVEYWRTAKEQFPMPDGALENLSSSPPIQDALSTAEEDCVQNRPVEPIENNSTSGEFIDSSSGGVFRESSSDRSPESPSCVAQNRPVESISQNNLSGSPPETSPGDVSQNLDSEDSPAQPSSVMQSPPVEAVNENDRSGSPPDILSGDVSGELSPGEFSAQQSHLTQNHSTESITEDSSLDNPPDAPPGDVSRKVALDFTEPDWSTFPWEPKNGWQPGAERERSRRHKAEWCRNQLLRVSSDEEMHELFHQLGDCALECLEWVDRNLLTPHEIASRHARIDASRNCQQQSLLE